MKERSDFCSGPRWLEGKGIPGRKRILTKALKLLSRIMNNPD